MKRWILAMVVVLAAVVVPLGLTAGSKKVAVADAQNEKSAWPSLEEGRSYFFASEFSGDIRKLHADTSGSVEGEYLGEQRGSWIKIRQTRGESNEKPTVFWLNLDRVTVIKAWPRVGE